MTELIAALHAAAGWLGLLALALALAALIYVTLLRNQVRVVSPDLRRLVRDMEGKRGEEVVRDLLGNMEFLGERVARVEMSAEDLDQRLQGAVQSMGLVRYNADATVGGGLSFALALLDARHTGVILTNLHTLEECRLYVRSVEGGRCAHDLSDEEAEALDQALGHRDRTRPAERRTRRPHWRARER